MCRTHLLLVAVIVVLQTNFSRAQESMMTDISYMFLEKLITTAKENYHRINSFEGRIKDSETKEKVKLAQYELDEYQLTLETEVKKRYFSYIRALTNLRLQTKITSEALNISHNIKTRF